MQYPIWRYGSLCTVSGIRCRSVFPSTGYHPNAIYKMFKKDSTGQWRHIQICSRFNMAYCQHQEFSHCVWVARNDLEVKPLVHACTFVLPCCNLLCGSKEHSAVEHKLLPAHCFLCYSTKAKEVKLRPKFVQ